MTRFKRSAAAVAATATATACALRSTWHCGVASGFVPCASIGGKSRAAAGGRREGLGSGATSATALRSRRCEREKLTMLPETGDRPPSLGRKAGLDVVETCSSPKRGHVHGGARRRGRPAGALGAALNPFAEDDSPRQQQQQQESQQHQQELYEVVFVRHGQSTWNKANRFIGWTDTELTEEGEIEARVAGQVLLAEGFEFDVVYTSMLKRAIKTAWVVLDELSQQHVQVIADWHLNERCYGALVGREKKECVRHFGAEQVKTWRRSYDIPPPPIDPASKLWPGNNPRYDFLMKDGESQVPLHESLKDVLKRSSVYWDEVIAPAIRSGKRVCVCGHENNLRSLLKHVDGISDEDILNVELPRAVPLVYHLDQKLRPLPMEGAAPYLSGQYAGDPEEIAAIMDRDFKNVYDLSVSQNLEESERRFAAKLADVDEPCSVEGMDGVAEVAERTAASAGVAVDGDVGFRGTFLETGVGEDSCRSSAITSTPLLLYNRGQKKRRRDGGKEVTGPPGREEDRYSSAPRKRSEGSERG